MKAEQSKPAERGKYCCKVIEDAKKIKNLCSGTGRSVAEIQGENPDLAIWKVRDALTEEDDMYSIIRIGGGLLSDMQKTFSPRLST